MSYSVTNLKSEIAAMIHGTTINKVTNINGLIYRAARQLLLDLDPQEMKRTQALTSAIYSQVYDYSLPDDLKGNKVIDIKPQVNRNDSDVFNQSYSQQFDISKTGLLNQFNIDFNKGVKTIRIADNSLTPGVVLNEADSTTSNGTWTAGGTASGLTTDNVNYVSGGSSLQFNMTAGTGYLENSTISSTNINSWLNQGNLFLYTYLPTASTVTSVTLRWGSSSSNYYTQTATVNQSGNSFINGWNLLSFPWSTATTVGSPDATKITYLRVSWVSTGAQTAMRLDNIVARLGSIFNIMYYSKYLFKDATTGGWQETITDDSNIINLDTESYNLLVYQCGIHLAQQLQGLDAMFYDGNYFQSHYSDALARYRNMYKSEVQKPEQAWYPVKKPGYTRYVNWRLF